MGSAARCHTPLQAVISSASVAAVVRFSLKVVIVINLYDGEAPVAVAQWLRHCAA